MLAPVCGLSRVLLGLKHNLSIEMLCNEMIPTIRSAPRSPEATLQVHQSLEGARVVELQLSGPDSMVALNATRDVRRQFVPKKT
jgi:hypothetical protein